MLLHVPFSSLTDVKFSKAAVSRATEEGRALARGGLSSSQAAAAAAFVLVSVDQVDNAWAEVIAALPIGLVDSPHFRRASC